MAQTPTKEELVAKYGDAFNQIESMTFGVKFPDKQSYILRLLTPTQYRKFVDTMKTGLKDMLRATQSKFEIYDSPHEDKTTQAKLLNTLNGANVTRAPKPQWETDEDGSFKKNDAGKKIPLLDEYGKQVMESFPNIRIEVAPLDIQEYPRSHVRIIPPTPSEMVQAFDDLLWSNARVLLQILFPAESERFTEQYVNNQINVPFMRTLFGLVVDMNGLEFLIPFVKEMFPMIEVLFESKKMVAGKQTPSTK